MKKSPGNGAFILEHGDDYVRGFSNCVNNR